jgi:hypothetical protein
VRSLSKNKDTTKKPDVLLRAAAGEKKDDTSGRSASRCCGGRAGHYRRDERIKVLKVWRGERTQVLV